MRIHKRLGIAIFGALILSVAGFLAGGKASPAYADPGPYWPQLPSYCVQYQYQLQWQLRTVPGQWLFIGGFWQFVPPYQQWVQVPVPVCVRYAFIISRFPMVYPQYCNPWANLYGCYGNQYSGFMPFGTYY
jgi:hypothetical protein